MILNEADLSVAFEARDSKQPLTVARFSPDGDTLAVASEDGCAYLYSAAEEFESIGKCRRHTMPIRWRINDGWWMNDDG